MGRPVARAAAPSPRRTSSSSPAWIGSRMEIGTVPRRLETVCSVEGRDVADALHDIVLPTHGRAPGPSRHRALGSPSPPHGDTTTAPRRARTDAVARPMVDGGSPTPSPTPRWSPKLRPAGRDGRGAMRGTAAPSRRARSRGSKVGRRLASIPTRLRPARQNGWYWNSHVSLSVWSPLFRYRRSSTGSVPSTVRSKDVSQWPGTPSATASVIW